MSMFRNEAHTVKMCKEIEIERLTWFSWNSQVRISINGVVFVIIFIILTRPTRVKNLFERNDNNIVAMIIIYIYIAHNNQEDSLCTLQELSYS